MEILLRRLLDRLYKIGTLHEEIYDTECRDRMGRQVLIAFMQGHAHYESTIDFGMSTLEANQAVHDAIADYVTEATKKAKETGLVDFPSRLAAFQNSDVGSTGNEVYYDDFFGHVSQDHFDALGNQLG